MKENKSDVNGKYKDKILTLEEAAKYIRIGKSTLYRCRYKIGFRKPPVGKITFDIADLDAWLEKSKIPAGTVKG
jgi:excisionase family DNA binding protein